LNKNDPANKDANSLKEARTEDFDLLTDLIDELLNNPLFEIDQGKYDLAPHTAFELF